jgi:hypothetical protein
MLKLASGIYGRHDLEPELRCRAAVAAGALGNTVAAQVQWWLAAQAAAEGSRWAELAAEGLSGQPLAAGVPPLGGPPLRSSPAKRFRLAEEFRRAGVLEERQIVMEYLKVLTVARPPAARDTAGMLGAAAFRLAECLETLEDTRLAREWYRRTRDEYPDTPWAHRARQALTRLAESADADAAATDGR